MQTATGRLQDQGLDTSECHWSMWMHLSVLVGAMVIGPFAAAAPLVIWLTRRKQSVFNDDHGREVLNMSITGVSLFALGAVAGFGIGLVAWVGWAIVAFIGIIRGAVAASNGEYFRYPMTIRFLS